MDVNVLTLEQCTAEEVFTHIAKHLLKQNRRSEGGGICRYRFGKLSCAAGCLFTDSTYDSRYENISWMSLVGDEKVPMAHRGLISDLQRIHDDVLPDVWEMYLTEFAKKHGFHFNADELRKE